jgi:drug/metabolite transporter (DMT)-like permease
VIGPHLALLSGVIACSLSVIFIRESGENPILLSAWRLLIAVALLSPAWWLAQRRHRQYSLLETLRYTWLPGLVLGLHFIAWNQGARMTPAANASLIVNLVPLVMPFFVLAMFGERLRRAEWLATGIALAGMLLLSASDFDIDPAYLWGDLVCLLAMLLFAAYLALGRKNNHFASLWLYIVPVYLIAGLSTLAVGLAISEPLPSYPLDELIWIVALAVVPTIIGHSALNFAMQRLNSQLVSIVNMGQFISAGFAAWLIYAEVPQAAFYLAAALMVWAVWLVIRSSKAGV